MRDQKPMIGNTKLSSPYSCGYPLVNWTLQRSVAWSQRKCVQLAKSFVTAAEAGVEFCFDSNFIFYEHTTADGKKEYVYYDGQQRLTTTTLIALVLLRLYRGSVTGGKGDRTKGLSDKSAKVLELLHAPASIRGDIDGGEPGTGGAFSYIGENGTLKTSLSIKRGANEVHLDDLLHKLAFMPEEELDTLSGRGVSDAHRTPRARLANNFLGILEYFRSLELDDESFAKLVTTLYEFKTYYIIYTDDAQATSAYVNTNNGTPMSFAGLMRVAFADSYTGEGKDKLAELLNDVDSKYIDFVPKSIFSARSELNGADLVYRLMLSSTMTSPIPAGDSNGINLAELKAELPTADDACDFVKATYGLLDLLQAGGQSAKEEQHSTNKFFAQFIYLLATQGNDTSSFYACFYLLRKLKGFNAGRTREVLDAFIRLYLNVVLFGAVNAPRGAGNTFYDLVRSTVVAIGVDKLSRVTLDRHFSKLTGPWAPNSAEELVAFLTQERVEPKSMDVLNQLFPAAAAYSEIADSLRRGGSKRKILHNYSNGSFFVPHKSGVITVVGATQAHSDQIKSFANDGHHYFGTSIFGHSGVQTGEGGTQSLREITERILKPSGIHISGTKLFAELSNSLVSLLGRGDLSRGSLQPAWVAENKLWLANKLADTYAFRGVTLEKLQNALTQRFGDSGIMHLTANGNALVFDLDSQVFSDCLQKRVATSWTKLLELAELVEPQDFVDNAIAFSPREIVPLKELVTL